ncbi:MAG TPA: ATP-binding protein [Bacillota bacterium]|nr:ATP-binding protein [Bacillota bacterium]
MSKPPKKVKRIGTGSLAFRLALRNALNMLLAFIVIDIFVVVSGIWPEIALKDGFEAFFNSLAMFIEESVTSGRFTLLFQIEGAIVLFRLIFDTVGIKASLKPLDEMAKAAEKLSNLDDIGYERFQRLESAIESFKPAEGESISTGDNELAGIEAAVNKLVDRMRAAYVQQSRFVSNASHELRTPIAVIRGYADMLDRWGKNDEKVLKESIDAIKTESESMQRLVEQLLFLARGDSGRQRMEFKSFNLYDMLSEVRDESEMIDSKRSYIIKGETNINVRGDFSMLKQTARVLAENAAKYSPEGSEIVLTVFNKDGRPGFSVQDSGIGIAKKDIPHLFERFYRADSSRSKSSGGTGLGLSIAKLIVDKHGGNIDVVSVEDIGTRFSVYL